jgi:hypothetical protein
MPEDIKKIKVSIPGESNKLDISQFIESNDNQIGNIKFFINDDDLKEADAWFVLEDPIRTSETCVVPKNNILYFSAEASYPIGWYDNQKKYSKFFSQFSKVISCHPLIHKNLEFEPPYLPWAINANHGTFFKNHFRDFDYLRSSSIPLKTKLISVICSNQEFTPSHKLRLRFVENLKKNFGDQLDWYGNGVNSVSEKWEAIAPYKYTIVLEGQSRNAIVTEKIGDAYLGGSYPIYWGAPDIDRYFPNCPRQDINILNFSETVKIIETILNSAKYENSINEISKAKNIVLNDFNFIYRFKKKFDSLSPHSSKSRITLLHRKHFISLQASPFYMIPLNLIGRIFRRVGNNIVDFSS